MGFKAEWIASILTSRSKSTHEKEDMISKVGSILELEILQNLLCWERI